MRILIVKKDFVPETLKYQEQWNMENDVCEQINLLVITLLKATID